MKYSKFTNSYFFSVLKSTLFCAFLVVSCKNSGQNVQKSTSETEEISSSAPLSIINATEQTEAYFPLLKGKKVGIVSNPSGIIRKEGKTVHLVDTLLHSGIKIECVFAPEHGFRGKADAGEIIKGGKDIETGLEVISLYGKNKKPSAEQLKNIEVMLFDLQDVGVRFYTYISTLHYVMEACAEQHIPLIVLDRPNPNAHYIDGPVLQPKFKSFVGMHPVPVVYGMTIGEYAQMINGEKWLDNQVQTDLTVIPLKNYTHSSDYELPVKPSPNLPNAQSINLYPSLCFFEPTIVSIGRGTELPFQVFGSPYMYKTDFEFTPQPTEGAKNPKWKDKTCYGVDLSKKPKLNQLNLEWLKRAIVETSSVKIPFFTSENFFDKLAGNEVLRKQLIQQLSDEEIRETWQKDLDKFKKIRSKYLIYKE